ncbi:MAG: hypothetical protein PHI97_22375 [Desulfobulbus sp.]|nr:hypothetical protein [Desulfobulbus sp.]
MPKLKERKKASRPEWCTYIFEITDPKMGYSFGVNLNKHLSPDPLSEYMRIEFTGRVIKPEQMRGALIACRIYGDRHYPDVLQNPTKYHNFNPEFVGMLNYKKNAADFSGWISSDAFFYISHGIHTGMFNTIDLYGGTLYHGKADILRIGFEKEYDPEIY